MITQLSLVLLALATPCAFATSDQCDATDSMPDEVGVSLLQEGFLMASMATDTRHKAELEVPDAIAARAAPGCSCDPGATPDAGCPCNEGAAKGPKVMDGIDYVDKPKPCEVGSDAAQSPCAKTTAAPVVKAVAAAVYVPNVWKQLPWTVVAMIWLVAIVVICLCLQVCCLGKKEEREVQYVETIREVPQVQYVESRIPVPQVQYAEVRQMQQVAQAPQVVQTVMKAAPVMALPLMQQQPITTATNFAPITTAPNLAQNFVGFPPSTGGSLRIPRASSGACATAPATMVPSMGLSTYYTAQPQTFLPPTAGNVEQVASYDAYGNLQGASGHVL